MAEKPTKKKKVCNKLLFCSIAFSVFNSLTDTPVIYDKKAGYKGKLHGEINDKKPAPNAKNTLISDILLLLPKDLPPSILTDH
jgi:hypothetical protein